MMYAQFDENGICFCVGTPNITGIEATYDVIGMKYENGVWSDPNAPKEETTTEEVPPDTPTDDILTDGVPTDAPNGNIPTT